MTRGSSSFASSPAARAAAGLVAFSLAACGSGGGGGGDGGGGSGTVVCYEEACSESLDVSVLSLPYEPELFRDLDGDGKADAITRSIAPAEIVIYVAPDFTELVRHPADQLPRFLPAGDITHDGTDDFLLAGEGSLLVGIQAVPRQAPDGRSYLFLPESVSFDNGTSPQVPLLVVPQNGFGRLGATQLLGDLNGDGAADLLAASRYHDVDHVMAWSGADGSTLVDFDAKSENTVDQYFGMSIGSVGDVDADGFDDFAVGAPDYDDSGLYANPQGRAYIYSGGDGATVTPGTLLYTIEGRPSALEGGSLKYDGDELGWQAPVRLGDRDGDGHADFAMAAPDAKVEADTPLEGRLVAYSGVDGHVLWERTATPASADEYMCTESFATEVISAGDVNMDGTPDLAVLASDFCRRDAASHQAIFDHADKVYVLSGSDGSTLFSVVGEFQHLFAADLNGDGASDVIVERTPPSQLSSPTFTVVWGKP